MELVIIKKKTNHLDLSFKHQDRFEQLYPFNLDLSSFQIKNHKTFTALTYSNTEE